MTLELAGHLWIVVGAAVIAWGIVAAIKDVRDGS